MPKFILVTGHASGIGNHAAAEFHKAGYKVIGIDKAISNSLDAQIKQIKCDLSNYIEAENAFKKFDRIDFAINCAGVPGIRKTVAEIASEELIESYKNIFLPAFNACKLEIIKMKNNATVSKIINIASSTATVGGKKHGCL